MKGFVGGVLLGVVAGAAAEMALQTRRGRRTVAGRTVHAVTEAMDSAAAAMKRNLG